MFCQHTLCLCNMCAWQQRALDSLELELQMDKDHHGGAGN